VPERNGPASESRPCKSAEADRRSASRVVKRSGYAGDFFADDELVDIRLVSFVGEDGFEIFLWRHEQ